MVYVLIRHIIKRVKTEQKSQVSTTRIYITDSLSVKNVRNS